MAQRQGPRAQMVRHFLVFINIRLEDAAKIPKVPGSPAPRNLNMTRAITWLVGVTRRVARNSQWGGLFWGSGGSAPSRRRPMGVWGLRPQPPEAGGLGAKPPAAGGTGVWGRSPQRSKILHFFCKNNFILGLF